MNPLNLSKPGNFTNQTQAINMTAGLKFKKEIWIDCEKGSGSKYSCDEFYIQLLSLYFRLAENVGCNTINCSVASFNPSDVIQITLAFRIWEKTLSQVSAQCTIVAKFYLKYVLPFSQAYGKVIGLG